MERQQNWRDDRMSDCRSLGSNYRPCSQSRKISIGVMVDSFSQTRSKKLNEDVAAVPTAENVSSSKGNTMEDRQKGKGVTVPAIGKQTEVPNQDNSPWVSTRSFHQIVPSSEEADVSKQASRPPAASTMPNTSNGIKEALATHSVQFFENKVSTLQSGDGNQKRLYSVTNGREGWIDGAPAAAEEALVPEKEVIEEKANKTENMGNETLRTKLWEILGTVSSPNKQRNSQALETGTNNIKSGLKSDEKGTPLAKPRQNSNAVGNDSGSPNHTNRRPVTRSLTRRRSPTKVQQNKMKNAGSSSYKEKHLENNIFSFKEGWSGRHDDPSKRKSSRIKPHNLWFHARDNAYGTQQATDRSKTKSAAEKSSLSRGNTIGNSSLTKKKIELVNQENGIYGKDSHPSPVIEMIDQLRDVPSLQKYMDQLEDSTNPSSFNVVDPQDDLQSPTFKMKTPIASSPGSPLETSQRELDGHSPAGRVFNMERIRNFHNLLSSKSDFYKTNVQMESSVSLKGEGGELEDSPVVKSDPIMKKSHTENRNSESLSEASDSESSEDCSPVEGYKCTPSSKHIRSYTSRTIRVLHGSNAGTQGEMLADGWCQTPFLDDDFVFIFSINGGRADYWKPESLFPEIDKAEKPMFVFHPAKRHCNQAGVDVIRLSPTSGSPKGTEERFILNESSELNHEDGLASAVALFALALERVKSKMSSITSKKSAEILMSVAKEIHVQLQNAESQIQTDVGKLTSLGKTKRKRLETRFQEQQEKLKVIHERFKQEVNQHIQDCRSTLEGLEAHQMEFKGTVEKQKASHRKLLLQAEEAIETQLNDAQRKVSTVQKLAREKMIQLKYIIAEFLKDGLLS